MNQTPQLKNPPTTKGPHGKIIPSDEQQRTVENMTACGVPQHYIAEALGVDLKTLRKRFKDELAHALIKANASIATTLFQTAMGQPAIVEDGVVVQEARPPHVGALIFWLKARAGWSERHELTGPGGGPIETAITLKFVKPKEE